MLKLVTAYLDRSVDGAQRQARAAISDITFKITANESLAGLQAKVAAIDAAIDGFGGNAGVRIGRQVDHNPSINRLTARLLRP